MVRSLKVILIAHLAVSVAGPMEPPTILFHGRQMRAAVMVPEEDVMPSIASGRDPVPFPTESDAQQCGYVPRLPCLRKLTPEASTP